MMTDKELADKIAVILGIEKDNWGYIIESGVAEDHFHQDEQFVRDWRVVGNMMTRLRKAGFSILIACLPDGKCLVTISSPLPDRKEWDAQIVDDNDARAINEACVEALSK